MSDWIDTIGYTLMALTSLWLLFNVGVIISRQRYSIKTLLIVTAAASFALWFMIYCWKNS